MARRSDHTRVELQEMILSAAWRIIGAEGFEAVTARRIAAEINYAPGTIYNIFPSMDALYLQVNARTLDLLKDVLNSPQCHDPRRSPAINLKNMAALYMGFARDYRLYWLMLFSHRLPEGRKELAWYQAKIDQLFTPLESLLTPLFSNRQEKKRKMAGRVLWASVHGLCFLQETDKIPLVAGRAAADDMSSYLIDIFIAGLKA